MGGPRDGQEGLVGGSCTPFAQLCPKRTARHVAAPGATFSARLEVVEDGVYNAAHMAPHTTHVTRTAAAHLESVKDGVDNARKVPAREGAGRDLLAHDALALQPLALLRHAPLLLLQLAPLGRLHALRRHQLRVADLWGVSQ